ncbi:hypothetical protein PVAG01_07086 [Phlyctema vagabunda]|uniref:Uncharacterized protein n=1 Tax=Phlyctema vagabunda TaxID=108571 RepID=A0ABR4PBF2_9HELO
MALKIKLNMGRRSTTRPSTRSSSNRSTIDNSDRRFTRSRARPAFREPSSGNHRSKMILRLRLAFFIKIQTRPKLKLVGCRRLVNAD